MKMITLIALGLAGYGAWMLYSTHKDSMNNAWNWVKSHAVSTWVWLKSHL